jgi:hypothetical protein
LAAITIAIAAAACTAPAAPAPVPPSAAKLVLNPTSLSFPSGNSATMPNLPATVTNTGGQTAQSLAVSTTNGVYSLPANTCTTLAPGQSCTVTVQFCPGAFLGTISASLNVTAMSGGSLVSVSDPMIGTGIGP